MTNRWSKTAASQLRGIVRTIARELSRDDAQRWRAKIRDAVIPLRDFPEMGSVIPLECYAYPPANHERIRQVICNPYRIIYETVAETNRILAVLHGRQMISASDTRWN